MQFVVKTVQDTIGDTPPLAWTPPTSRPWKPAGGSQGKGDYQLHHVQARALRKAHSPGRQYKANMIALMWGPEGLPRDENERDPGSGIDLCRQ